MNSRPPAPPLHDLLRLFHANRLPEARALGLRLRRSDPRNREVLSILGALHGRLGEFSHAESCYRALIAIEPSSVRHHSYLGLGLSLVMQGRLADALEPFEAMLNARPDYAEGHLQMGCLLRDLGDHDRAIRHLGRAFELSPALVEAAVYRANILVFQGKLDEALGLCEQALSSRPGHPEVIASQALILEKQGHRDAAWDCVAAAASGPIPGPSIAIVYALLAPRYGQTGRARSMLEQLLAHPQWAPSQRQELNFALANLLDRTGDYEAAFTHYRAANALSPHRFDTEALRRKTEEITRFFPQAGLPAAPLPPEGTPTPVFIVGMPRSGTSLIEQILASHPEVQGA
ncbi:MAG: tetratricopeptide repeat protein, partial [Acidiferrobacterales bacterium]